MCICKCKCMQLLEVYLVPDLRITLHDPPNNQTEVPSKQGLTSCSALYLPSVVICSVCSTNFSVLQPYRDQCSELCTTLVYLMELVTMAQSSGLTDPITPLL